MDEKDFIDACISVRAAKIFEEHEQAFKEPSVARYAVVDEAGIVGTIIVDPFYIGEDEDRRQLAEIQLDILANWINENCNWFWESTFDVCSNKRQRVHMCLESLIRTEMTEGNNDTVPFPDPENYKRADD